MTSRIVVKIGSSSLTTEEGGLDRSSITFLPEKLQHWLIRAMKYFWSPQER